MNFRQIKFRPASCTRLSLKLALLLILGACSNPLSEKSQSVQNFHQANVNCNQLNFSSSAVQASDIRATLHCLNAHHEIEAAEAWLNHAETRDVQVLADVLNHWVQKNPRSLFIFQEMYQKAKANGTLSLLQNQLTEILKTPESAQFLTDGLKLNLDAILHFFTQPNTGLRVEAWFTLTHSQAYQRLMGQLVQGKKIEALMISGIHYAKDPDALSLDELSTLLTENKVPDAWEQLINTDAVLHLQKLAHFLEWLFQGDHFETLSQNFHDLTLKPVKCFNQSRAIDNPLVPAFHELAHQNAKEAAVYLKHDLKNLYWAAQGYCEFPHSLGPVLALMEEATEVPGFDEIYALVRPLLDDPRLIRWVSSQASARFVKANQDLGDRFFFQDLMSLISIDSKSPLSTDSAAFSRLIQSLLVHSDDAQVHSGLQMLQPVLKPEAAYGHQLIASLYRVVGNYPDSELSFPPSLVSRMASSSRALISLPEFNAVLQLTTSLMEENLLQGLLDQTLTYFHDLVMRAKIEISTRRNADPALAQAPESKWLLEKILFLPKKAQFPTCASISSEWNFSEYDAGAADKYLAQLDGIMKCVDANQSFISARELIQYSSRHSELGVLIALQKNTIDHLFSLNPEATLIGLEDFLNLSAADLRNFSRTVRLASQVTSKIESSYLNKPNLRTWVSKILESPKTYVGIEELLRADPPRPLPPSLSLDVPHLKVLNAIVTREQKLKHVKVDIALQSMLKEYCPSLDADSADCDLDEDQLALYLQSPKALYAQISKEFLESSQSWMHPVLASGFTHSDTVPAQVSDLEYHLNPILHLMKGNPQAPRAVVSALEELSRDQLHLANFLEERATRLTLIPYRYQVPNYPLNSKQEFTDRIRIRLVSDLDRLELIAINADFQAFGFVSNLGMSFIREIGLAWGDVPEAKRPSKLSQFKSSNQVRTLKEVKEFIEAELLKFDTNAIQNLGSCDPRGRGGLRRFISTRLCNHQIFDLSARLFNLRFLVSLLGEELPSSEGGSGGLVFLRDLFYSLYTGNSPAQINAFANGVNLNSDCLTNPSEFTALLPECQKDLLTLVPRIAHLGLLHQAGIAILTDAHHPIHEIGSLIERTAHDPELGQAFIRTLSQDAVSLFIQDAANFIFQAPAGTAKTLSLFGQALSTVPNSNLMMFGLELVSKFPHALRDHLALVNSLIGLSPQGLSPWVQDWLKHPDSAVPQSLSQISQDFDLPARNDAVHFVIDLTPVSQDLAAQIQAAGGRPGGESPVILGELRQWSHLLSLPRASSDRKKLGEWSKSAEFDQTCKLLSDSSWVDKASQFFESVNQNPDSKKFLQSCRNFLDVH